MITLTEYIKMILQKKQWSNAKFCSEINEIEDKLGDKRTSIQNITNYLNNTDGLHNIGYKMALKMEKALGLPQETLVQMVKNPIMESSKKEFNDLKKKVRNL